MTNQEAIEKFKKIKRGDIFLIHQRIEGKEVVEDYSLCDTAISALQALDEIYAFIMKSEASETTDGVLEIFDALESQEAKTQLSAEGTTSDLISRQKAIEVIEEMQMPIMRSMFPEEQFVFKGMSEALRAIKDLPSAQPEPHWIPCSERLPENYGNYLISIHGEEPDIGTINPNDKRGWSLCDANGFHWASDKKLIVTAWMPLPEQYRAERRTDGRD